MYDNCDEQQVRLQPIGDSKFFFNVWYKITNEKALTPCGYCGNGWDMDRNEQPATYLVGDYSREKFNSVKFHLDVYPSHIWDGKWNVKVLCFADTRECGAETIVHLTTDDIDNIDKRLFEYAAEVLVRSGAVVDKELVNAELKRRANEIARMQIYNNQLEQILGRE